MYRLHPQTARLVGMVRSGLVGEVRLIDNVVLASTVPAGEETPTGKASETCSA